MRCCNKHTSYIMRRSYGAGAAPPFGLSNCPKEKAAWSLRSLLCYLMCLKPILCARNACHNPNTGKFGIHFNPTLKDFEDRRVMQIPCGKCLGCLNDRRNGWCNRMALELFISGCGTFLTLTYRNAPLSLDKAPLQKFFKRLRNVERDFGISLSKDFKYFACGERGSRFGRPHYHAILFGVDMFSSAWQPYLATYKDGYPVFASRVIDRVWKHGFNVIGEANTSSVRYVSKYITKKFNDVDDDSFTLKSLRLGVGFFFDVERVGRKVSYRYQDENKRHLVIDGNVMLPDGRGGSRHVRVPSCYSRYIEKIDLDDFELATINRQLDAEHFMRVKFDRESYIQRLLNDYKQQKRKEKL